MRWLEQFLCGLVGHVPESFWNSWEGEKFSDFCVHCLKDLS